MRRETGKEQSVQVRRDEGVGIRISLEPYVVVRRGDGVRRGVSSPSLEKAHNRGVGEADWRVNASPDGPT
jgi:hypothetical protein